MKLLFVDCCISQRGENSRTAALAKTYLEVKHRPIYITRETEQDRDERKPAQQK